MTTTFQRRLQAGSLGPLWAACDEKGLQATAFSATGLKQALALCLETDQTVQQGSHLHLEALEAELRRFASGKKTAFDLPWTLPPGFPPFLAKVLRLCRRIPWGTSVSYGELARRAGNPRGARAVGQAMNRNPLPC